MKKVLITGGAGFIGSNLALALLNAGYKVTVLDNLSKQIHGENPEITSPLYRSIADKANFIMGSVTDEPLLRKAISNNEVIVHLAAETGTGQSMYQIDHYSRVNIGGTALMMSIIANEHTSVKKIVVASSRAIYGEGKYLSEEKGIVYPKQRSASDMEKGDFEVKFPGSNKLSLMPTDEDSLIHPTSVYGITKQVQEQLVMTVSQALNIGAVGLRFQNVYGPGQSLSNPYTGILSIFSTRIRTGASVNIFEDGKESRDFVFISDVVDSIVLAIENDVANGNVFNVGTGTPTTVSEVVERLMQAYQKEVNVTISGNFRIGDIRHNYADLTKIRQLLGFEPKVAFLDGIGKFAEWVMQQDAVKDNYEASLIEMKEKGLLK